MLLMLLLLLLLINDLLLIGHHVVGEDCLLVCHIQLICSRFSWLWCHALPSPATTAASRIPSSASKSEWRWHTLIVGHFGRGGLIMFRCPPEGPT